MIENERRTRLQREWVLCGVAAAASRFVPVPMLDDVIAGRAVRTAVARTWAAHGRAEAPDVVDILTETRGGFWGGVGSAVRRLPLTLLLYPIRKVLRLVTAVRGVSRDFLGVILLARAVDRSVERGLFDAADPATVRRQARLVRHAHEQTVANVDLRVLEHAVRGALDGTAGARRQAVAFARQAFGRGADRADSSPVPEAGGSLDRGAARVVEALDTPELARVFADLDARFDASLAQLSARQDSRS